LPGSFRGYRTAEGGGYLRYPPVAHRKHRLGEARGRGAVRETAGRPREPVPGPPCGSAAVSACRSGPAVPAPLPAARPPRCPAGAGTPPERGREPVRAGTPAPPGVRAPAPAVRPAREGAREEPR